MMTSTMEEQTNAAERQVHNGEWLDSKGELALRLTVTEAANGEFRLDTTFLGRYASLGIHSGIIAEKGSPEAVAQSVSRVVQSLGLEPAPIAKP